MKGKILYIGLAASLSLGIATACKSDIEKVYVLPGESITLSGDDSDVILKPGDGEALALSIFWTGDGKLTLSDDNYQAADNAAEETIQLSSSADFGNYMELPTERGVRYHQFLNDELNALLDRLDYPTDVMTPLYIRICSVLSDNIDPAYSNIFNVNVQKYGINKKLATVLDNDRNETEMTLGSRNEDGIYSGFLGITGWYNWFLQEADNVVWGNLAVVGDVFYASSDDFWNFWYPEPSGCYFTTVNTVEGWWSALYINNLSVSGDISGDLTYDQKANKWSMNLNGVQPGTYNINISGEASLYDVTTGDVGQPISKNVAFGGSADDLEFGETGSSVSVEIKEGHSALLLDLNNPLNFSVYSIE